MAFSPRTTSLTVVRPRAQKPADERFFEKLDIEVGSTATLVVNSFASRRLCEQEGSFKACLTCPKLWLSSRCMKVIVQVHPACLSVTGAACL